MKLLLFNLDGTLLKSSKTISNYTFEEIFDEFVKYKSAINGVSHPRNSVLMRIFLKLGIVEHTGHGIPKIISKYGKEAFDIHDTYINVVIPFNKDIVSKMSSDKNDGKNLFNNDLTDNEKRVCYSL